MDFGFPAVLALLCLHGDGAFLLQTFAVCMLHEAGHGIAMLLTGAGIREIHLYAAGIQMRTHAAMLSKGRELIILFSGPCMNFAAAFCLYLLQGWGSGAMLHLCMGLFNLLPYTMLDGGSVLACVCSENHRLLRMQTVLCLLLSLGLSVLMIVNHIRNPFLYLICCYLAAAQLRVDKQGGMW